MFASTTGVADILELDGVEFDTLKILSILCNGLLDLHFIFIE